MLIIVNLLPKYARIWKIYPIFAPRNGNTNNLIQKIMETKKMKKYVAVIIWPDGTELVCTCPSVKRRKLEKCAKQLNESWVNDEETTYMEIRRVS